MMYHAQHTTTQRRFDVRQRSMTQRGTFLRSRAPRRRDEGAPEDPCPVGVGSAESRARLAREARRATRTCGAEELTLPKQ